MFGVIPIGTADGQRSENVYGEHKNLFRNKENKYNTLEKNPKQPKKIINSR